MEFGSKFVYNYSDSEEESVSDEEFETGIDETCVPPVLGVRAADVHGVSSLHLPHTAASAPSSGGGGCKKKIHNWMMSSTAASKSKLSAERINHGTSDSAESRSGKRWRRADTNVVAVRFDQLKKPSYMHTGDAVHCASCLAMMSYLSHVHDVDDNQIWPCEFCGHQNSVDVLPDELPKCSDVTYMLRPAPTTTAASCAGVDESLVIFCMDVSGSMCVSQEVEGRMRLRGNHADRYRSLNPEGENQWIPGQNRNVTYITRLQALQAAVDHQLKQLASDFPTRRVALITFNNEVTVVGDGRCEPCVIAGDKLNDVRELEQVASTLSLPLSIEATRASLADKIFSLEECGQTALGPAMLVAITMASKVAGSKVVMCTDGLANVGLGNLDVVDRDEYRDASKFYAQLGSRANEHGVTVSVLTIAGTNCQLVELGEVASSTGGQVNIVDPLKLTEEFGNILANPIIASRVTATFIVHSGLYIRSADNKESVVQREVGNVTAESEVTFEYGIRPKRANQQGDTEVHVAAADDQAAATAAAAAAAAAEGGEQTPAVAAGGVGGGDDGAAVANMPAAAADDQAAAAGKTAVDAASKPSAARDDASVKSPRTASVPNELPFQVQIQYTDLDGVEAVRVLTQAQPVTKDRKQAETYINVPVVGVHAAQITSELALEGQYTPSRLNAFMYQRLVARNAEHDQYGAYITNIAPTERLVRYSQTSEAQRCNRTLMTYEDEDHSMSGPPPPRQGTGLGSKLRGLFGAKRLPSVSAPSRPMSDLGRTMRRQACSDEMSAELYKNKHSSASRFTTRTSLPPAQLVLPRQRQDPAEPAAAQLVLPPPAKRQDPAARTSLPPAQRQDPAEPAAAQPEILSDSSSDGDNND